MVGIRPIISEVEDFMTQIIVVSGSHRPGSQSLKVSKVFVSSLMGRGTVNGVSILDLADQTLPLWGMDETQGQISQVDVAELKNNISAASGFVIVCPEWHGMVPAALKNFFLHFSGGELAHKPALLTAVSSGIGGAYPISELRASSYKNSRICYLPEHLIVRNVESVLNENSALINGNHNSLMERLEFCVDLLVEYVNAFKRIRDSEVVSNKRFKNGM